jgi:NTE family protein
MIAFVLSGAGSRGPLQIGALGALLEAGIQPAFLVGTSAGAMNALSVAARGLSVETLKTMQAQWKTTDVAKIYPGNLFTTAWRVLRGRTSLYDSGGFRRLIEAGLPDRITTFGDLRLPLYVTSVDLLSNRLFLFGEDRSVGLVDAVLASATVPIMHPPVEYHGLQLVDGGVLANVAASVAMDKQATRVYVINAGYGGLAQKPVRGIIDVANYTMTAMMGQSLLRDLARARTDNAIDLHHIHLPLFREVSYRDFSHTDAMVQAGYEATRAYLAAPQPQVVAPVPARPDLGETVRGARELIPPHLIGN